ncbi:DUF5717 family protein [Lachnospiraceae bacterium 45-W7]
MQRKIEELAAGICHCQSSILEFTPEKLEFEVLEGTVYTGEFSIQNTNHIPIEGKIYSSSPRMQFPAPEFQGIAITQKFEFHSEGLCEGDTQAGNLHIISDQGEYLLPFAVSVSRKYPLSSQGFIKSVTEFANLARESYEEAVKIFGQPEFAGIFGLRETEERLIYQGLFRKPCTRAQVEEFLIAARKKKRVLFGIEETQREFCNVAETQLHYVTLKKEEWGHLALEIAAQGEWLQPLKRRITDEDFVGSRGIVEYKILPEKLHAGKNYGRLTLQTPFQKEEIELCVLGKRTGREQTARSIQKKQAELAHEYLNFGFRKTVTGVWAKRSGKMLEELLDLDPENLWYLLMKAQVFLVNRQRQEAEWVMDSFPRNKVDKNSPMYGYYLYLCTLREPEPAYVNKCTGQIRKIYHKNQENEALLWILLFLDEELNYSKGRKLEVIAKHLRRNGESVLLYLEAWRILEKEPFHLRRAGEFERKILNFAVKYQVLNKEMAQQIVKLVPEIPVFDAIWYKILAACCEMAPNQESLQAICSYCIKGHCYGSEYWNWYQKGVEEELRIAGLYESWVLSADCEQMRKLPKSIVLYFQSYSNLATDPQAKFYAAMINSKAQWKSVWPHYQKNIQEFALRQLKHGKVDSSFAVIYREILTPELLKEEQGKYMGQVLFACEVTCSVPEACNLVLCQHPLKKEQTVPFVHGKGYVNIYSSSWQILLEDARGRRFLPGDDLKVTPLMESAKFLEKGIACAEQKLPYLLKYFDKKRIWQTFEKEDLPWLEILVESKAISDAYREELRPQMVEYFYDNYTGDTLDEFLLNLSFEGIEKQAREKIMNLLVARRHYRRAYELLKHYGCENISPVKLVYVICHRLQEAEPERDVFLLGLCRNVFLRGKYNDQILMYMIRYFFGSLEEMLKLWHSACNFDLDTYELEEHCLERFLYTGDYLPDVENVFEHYAKSQGKEVMILAYLTRMCHHYVIRDAVVSDYIFQKITGLLKEGQKLNFICRLGFLKWCSTRRELSGEILEYSDHILKEALKKGRFFGFYENLPGSLKRKYLIHDRIILEYRTDPEAKVMLAYIPQGETEYVECEMQQMYDEIFAKEFLVFFGESLPYYIKEKQDGEWKVTQSGQMQSHQLSPESEESRYEMVNDMLAGWQMQDEETMMECLEAYGKLDEIVNKEFLVI